jgi:hypothetical protein
MITMPSLEFMDWAMRRAEAYLALCHMGAVIAERQRITSLDERRWNYGVARLQRIDGTFDAPPVVRPNGSQISVVLVRYQPAHQRMQEGIDA